MIVRAAPGTSEGLSLKIFRIGQFAVVCHYGPESEALGGGHGAQVTLSGASVWNPENEGSVMNGNSNHRLEYRGFWKEYSKWHLSYALPEAEVDQGSARP